MTDESNDDEVPATKADVREAALLVCGAVFITTAAVAFTASAIFERAGGAAWVSVCYAIAGFGFSSIAMAAIADGTNRRFWKAVVGGSWGQPEADPA